ncbi:MAG: ferredoxin [Chloroflexota bacterium]
MGVEVTVDADLCIGSGDCIRLVPGAFRMDDDRGVSIVLDAASVEPGLLVLAARGCPTQAIRVTRDGEVLHASN